MTFGGSKEGFELISIKLRGGGQEEEETVLIPRPRKFPSPFGRIGELTQLANTILSPSYFH